MFYDVEGWPGRERRGLKVEGFARFSPDQQGAANDWNEYLAAALTASVRRKEREKNKTRKKCA